MALMTLEPALGANDTWGLRRLHALVGGLRDEDAVALDALRATLAQWQQRQLATLRPKTRDLWATANLLADAASDDHLPRQRGEMCLTFTRRRARELVAAGLWHDEGDGWVAPDYTQNDVPRRPAWEQPTTRYQLRAFLDTLRVPETRQLADEVLVRVLEERLAQLTQLVEEARRRTRAFIEAREARA